MGRSEKLVKLFLSTLYLSAFTFGGGYVIISLMKDTFVDRLGWIDKQEMLDMTALAQSAPGAVAINAAVVVGFETCGILGMFVAILATILPPLIIISIISIFYKAFIANKYIAIFLKGMQAGVSALIFKVVYDMTCDLLKEEAKYLFAIMILSFVTGFFFKVNIVYIIMTLIAFGGAYSWFKKGEGSAN
ncbi:chromate transporter [Anaerococcus tetradius]|uniref:chromate transporter n=1 Tax=Anaerococcus tetradius TaxID=33036 RepID=UPI0023F08E6F|nr:chromate transporter [Anaerococcus tetradius]